MFTNAYDIQMQIVKNLKYKNEIPKEKRKKCFRDLINIVIIPKSGDKVYITYCDYMLFVIDKSDFILSNCTDKICIKEYNNIYKDMLYPEKQSILEYKGIIKNSQNTNLVEYYCKELNIYIYIWKDKLELFLNKKNKINLNDLEVYCSNRVYCTNVQKYYCQVYYNNILLGAIAPFNHNKEV